MLYHRNPRGYGLFLREKIQFLDFSLRDQWELRISYIINVCDMYSTKLVAEAIGLPYITVAVLKLVRRIKRSLLGKNRG